MGNSRAPWARIPRDFAVRPAPPRDAPQPAARCAGSPRMQLPGWTMAPDSTSTNDATQLEPTPATEPKATPGMALAQAAPEGHADGTGTPSDAEGSEIIPESEAPPAKPPRVPLILTSVNGPLRDVFDDVDPQTPEPEDDDLAALKTYVLCFVERSGSTMLTDLMTKAGVLGRPEEYVNPRGPMVYLLREYPATELR